MGYISTYNCDRGIFIISYTIKVFACKKKTFSVVYNHNQIEARPTSE